MPPQVQKRLMQAMKRKKQGIIMAHKGKGSCGSKGKGGKKGYR